MKILAISLLLVINSAFSQEPIPSKKVIVVSDIDDTLKISHVRNAPAKFIRGFWPYAVFPGMNYLYHTIGTQFRRSNFYYVSAALKKISFYMHSKTLEFAAVPAGELILREGQDKKEFKLAALRRILSSNTTKRVIMFGDNAEYDPIVYDQIRREFPQKRFLIFMRKAYPEGNPILEGQIPFVSPLEVAVALHEHDIITFEKMKWLIDRVLSLAEKDMQETGGKKFFPGFTRESGFDVAAYFESYQRYVSAPTLCAAYF